MAPRRLIPETLDALQGLRAARWTRESTGGQFDAFGPDAQREHQDRMIERYGLVDSGRSWSIAHSGRTAWQSAAWHEMLTEAGSGYDVLVVGYVSRFARNLKQALIARDDLHARGAVILFADERLLTSDESRWDEFVREAHEAEAYSRKLSRRVREGLAAKRRVLGEPGGRPPYGFTRDGRPPVLVPIPERIDQVRLAFERSAGGETDQEVAAAVELPLFTVRGILTNPIYIGRLRDGTAARVDATIDPALWNAVARRRSRRATNAGRPAAPSRAYGLRRLLVCEACQAPLIGDTGTYRHRDSCEAFQRAVHAERRPSAGRSASVPATEVDLVTGRLLERFALRADSIARIVGAFRAGDSIVDTVAIARIERQRADALDRYRRDRDATALERSMADLDRAEAVARQDVPTLRSDEVVEVLRSLPAAWREAPGTRHHLAESLFDRVELLGSERITYDLSAHAIALGIADGMPSSLTISGGYGRGERARTPTYHVRLRGLRLRRRAERTA